MYKKHIPGKSLLKKMEEFNIAADDILTVTGTDFSVDSQYTFSWLVLTKDWVYLLFSDKKAESVDNYSRSDGRNDVPSDARVEKIALSDIEKIETIPLAAGCIISVTEKGVSKKLCACTATCTPGANHFVRCVMLAKEEDYAQINELNEKRRFTRGKCPKCGTPYKEYGNCICPRCNSKRSAMIRLLKYFLPHKGMIAVMTVCIVLSTVVNLFAPYLSGTVLYGEILEGKLGFTAMFGDGIAITTALLITVLTIVGSKLLTQIFTAIQNVAIAKIVPYVVRDIKSKIFAAMSKLSLSFFQRRETGSLMTRVLDDAEQVTNLFIEDAPKLMVDGITIVGVAISMFAISWPVAIAAIVFIPLSSLITIRVMPKMWVYFGMKFRASRNMNAHINDNLAGARVVRAFGQQDSEEKRFEKLNEKVKAAEFKIVGVQNELYATYHLIQNIGVFAVWGLGSFLVLKQFDFSYANIITLIGYVGMLSGPVSDISKALRQLANCMNSTQRIFEILDSKPDIKEKDNPVFPDHIKGDIKVDKITFGYEKDKPVLHELSFEVKAGEMLGVVGRSGAGKTTLLCLISRLYDPEDGNIFIDGINIRDMELDKLHRSIAVVSQETYIFMGTVAENIAYAYPDISRDKIIEAAIAARAHDFISKLPDGYDTIIGTSGRELSGGERQRISIARAILANPRILILDEATASMDTETEQNIQRSLEMLAKGRTTISVAHRLSTLRNADRLIVLEDGRLEESGTHNELIEKQGIYYRLAQLQSKSMTIEGDDMLWKTNDFMPRGPMGGPMGGPPPMGPPMGGPPPMGPMR